MHVRVPAAALAFTSLLSAQGLTIQFPATMQRDALPQLTSTTARSPVDIKVGDINGDRVPDLVFAGQGGAKVYLQGKATPTSTTFVGAGQFFDITSFQPIFAPLAVQPFGLQSFACELADLNGDGILDLLLATSNVGLQVFVGINNGTGVFTMTSVVNSALGTFNAEDLAAGDVDGDGDVDFVLATSIWPTFPQTRLLLFLNNGAGAFVEATVPNLPVVNTFSQSEVRLFDRDGDGDLDLFVARVANAGAGESLLLDNLGAGVFANVTAATVGINRDPATSVDSGDVDGDGDIDILVGSLNGSYLLRFNPVAGTYARVPVPIPNGPSSTLMNVRLADIDEDCDLDIVSSHDSGQRTQLLRNNGAGGFAADLAQIFDDTGRLHSACTLADLDGDGDNDVIMGAWADPMVPIDVRYNNLRDFDGPRTASASAGSYQYDLSFAPGTMLGVALAVVGLHVVARSPFVPLPTPVNRNPCGFGGNLWGLPVDMATLAFGVPVVPPGSQLTVQGLVPAMIGLTFFAQAGYIDPVTTEIHMLQVVATRIQ